MHSVQLTKGLFRNFSAAFFVFFAAAAGTRIIRTDFLFGVSELFGFTPLLSRGGVPKKARRPIREDCTANRPLLHAC